MSKAFAQPAFRLLLLLVMVFNVSAVEVSITASTTATVAKEEGLVAGEFVISRGNADVSDDLEVNWTIGGATTATAVSDFTIDPGTSPITIPAGQSSVILRLVPVQDALREGEEIVSIRLTPGSYDLGGNQSAQMAIADNDVVISVEEFDKVAHEDFTTGISPVLDPNLQRRGVLRVNLNQPMGETFLLNTVVSPLASRSATLGSDYTLTYKIGGNGMGAGLGYKVQPRYAYVPGATSIAVIAGAANIATGATVNFAGDSTNYFVVSGANTPQGTITISPGLVEPLSNATEIEVDGSPTNWRVNKANTLEPIGTTELVLVDGIGGFAVGDTFRIDGQTGVTFVVESVTSNDVVAPTVSIIKFYAYLGTGGPGGGLVSILDGEKAITTHFTPDPGLEIQLAIPGESAKVDFGITPISDTAIEASETVSMFIRPSNAFKTTNPVSGIINIADDDLTVAFNPTLSVNATEGGANGSFRVVLSGTFPHQVDIPYKLNSAASTATAPPSVDFDYQALLPLSIPPGQTSGTISVTAVADASVENSGETLSLTLLPSIDYRLVSSPGSTEDASATISINDLQGTVSIEPKTGATTGREHPTTPETAAFTVRIARPNIPMAPEPPVTISYTVSGTASQGADFTTLSGSVIIPENEDSIDILISPLDDSTPEINETVSITLSPGLGYIVSTTQPAASVNIADDEPVMSITRVGSNISEGAGTDGIFRVSYPGPSLGRQITVSMTYSGTATAPGDYNTAPATVVIPADKNSADFPVVISQDTTPEGDETVIATISASPTTYTIATASATLTILDDEPVVKIEKIADTTEDSTTAGSFRVYYDGTSLGRDIVVSLSYPTTTTATGTAADFTTTPPTTVTIPSTGTSVTFSLLAKYDGIAEGTENFQCTITANAAVYTIGTASATFAITDRIPTLTLVGDKAIAEGGTFKVKVESSFKPLTPFTVNYTISGDATAGASAGGTADYKTLSGSIQISELSNELPVETFTDATYDPWEEVIITLTEATVPTFINPDAPTALETTVQILDGERRVDLVESPDPSGTYDDGDTIDIGVTFTQPVKVSGTPVLRLETGANDATASYKGLSTDKYTLLFEYTVRPTDQSNNLECVNISALSVVGGIIVNENDEAMTLTLPIPGSENSLSHGFVRKIAGSIPAGKPNPGVAGGAGGGGCGLGSGVAGLVLCMLAGFALSILRFRR